MKGVQKNPVKNFLSPLSQLHPLHVEEQLILARDPSVQSLLWVDRYSTANRSPVMAQERSQIKAILKKKQ